MKIDRIHQLLTIALTKPTLNWLKFWLSLSITFAVIYALLGWREAFSSEYVVQDDARQHVFWMLRFLDPSLFPNDLIADYFQSVAPAGYTAVYKIFSVLGINPLLFNKFLPMVLGIITTCYCFGVSMQLLPVPAAGFITTLLLNQNLWMKDDLVSGTPRAFVYPLFLAFLYYVLRQNLWGVVGAIALLGLFYPHYLLISAVVLILRLFDWENKRLRLSQNQADLVIGAAGLGAAFLVLLPYALTSSKFGPAITAAAAKQLPEFAPGGRTQFFHENPWHFWFNGQRSGILPRQFFAPATLWFGLFLPIMLRFSVKFPLAKQVKGGVILLPQILLASVVMFFIAHILLFKLHVPSRYTGFSLRMLMSVAAGIALTVILEAILSKVKQNLLFLLPFVFLLLTLLLYPSFVPSFPLTKHKIGEYPALYEFFQKQPKNILIASLADEASNLPTFSQRSILASREYAIPYQVGYYNQFRQRTIDLIRAHYSVSLTEVKNFVWKYGVDFWLLESGAFTPEYVAEDEWMNQYQPVTAEALKKLQEGGIPVLSKMSDRCKVIEIRDLVVLDAKCTVETP